MDGCLKLLRYNTGTDKKLFASFNKFFDAVIFNSTIVAYSGKSIADLVSIYTKKYIIDPQTHIFQQTIASVSGDKGIKNSVLKYLNEYPDFYKEAVTSNRIPLSYKEFETRIDELVETIYKFEKEFVFNQIKEKEYDKYLKYANLTPEPKLIIAPYFMIKNTYSLEESERWLELNKKLLEKTIKLNLEKNSKIPIAAQIVIEKQVLKNYKLLEKIIKTYEIDGFNEIFVWIDDFNAFEASVAENKGFYKLIKKLNEIEKKPIMAYGGYESIILCSKDSPCAIHGVAQSAGYGEYRSITPVGGGIPANKYYFYPLHQRLKMEDVEHLLVKKGFFDNEIPMKKRVNTFYKRICDCKICKEIIKDNLDNFTKFNESNPFTIKHKNGSIQRNRATNEALAIAAAHFLHCKEKEWKSINIDFKELKKELMKNYEEFDIHNRIDSWCDVYE